jgi:hypothetical protein
VSDNLIDAVGRTIQEERLARASNNLLLREAEQAGQGEPILARALATARRTSEMTVRTVAGIPIVIGGTARVGGFSRMTRLVRNPAAG